MEKKVTISDVAKAANVCKATVSYVLNDTPNQKISEATKNKIWQTVNVLNYKPNLFAKNLRGSHQKKTIAVFYPLSFTSFEKNVFFSFLEYLVRAFTIKNYSIVLLDGEFRKIENADAILSFGLNKDMFYQLGTKNFIPLIAVDCLINDNIFFEVTLNYDNINTKAQQYFDDEYFYLCTSPKDDKLKNVILSSFKNVIFINDYVDILTIKQKNIVVTDSFISDIISTESTNNVLYVEESLNKKLQMISNCVDMALSHETYVERTFKV